ncbi:MAG: HpcH/HpaI aldolase/citrate lyase family protein [Gammaproteobacteria bacterium]
MRAERTEKANSLKSRLARNELTIGSWVTLAHPSIAEIMAAAGFDWLVIDAEHSVIELADVQLLIQAMQLHDCPAIVRLTSNDGNQIKRVMDSGATGIMVPQVNNAEQATEAVQHAHYPPQGTRGVGLARAQGYGADFRRYVEWLPDHAVVVVMIEHGDAVKHIDEILAVDGVDAFIIGPYDLSASMGMPGEIDHPDVRAAIARTCEAGLAHGKPGGVHVVEPDRDQLYRQIDAGHRFLGYGLDIRILDAHCRGDLRRIHDRYD